MYDDDSTERGKGRKVAYVDKENKVVTALFNTFISTSTKCQSGTLIQNNKLSKIHGSVSIDLNMDCRPDLLLEVTDDQGNRAIETYFYEEGNKYCLVGVETFPDKAYALDSSSFSFVDLLNVGSHSAIIVDNNKQVHMMINKYTLPNPSNTSDSLCSGKEKLDGSGKHVAPFDGVTNFAKTFTDVIFLQIF